MAGTYPVFFQTSSAANGAQFQVKNSSNVVLATVGVPNTGSSFSFATVGSQLTLPAGDQTIRIYNNTANKWTLNSMEFGPMTNASIVVSPGRMMSTDAAKTEQPAIALQAFPNPVQNHFTAVVDNSYTGLVKFDLINTATGAVVRSYQLRKNNMGNLRFLLSAAGLPSGSYVLRAGMKNWATAIPVVKQ